jgi:predicted DNA-binding transcriptional regulator AlpA
MDQQIQNYRLLRLPQVLELIPVGKSTWWAGVKTGRFPKPLRLGDRCTVWRATDIAALVDHL